MSGATPPRLPLGEKLSMAMMRTFAMMRAAVFPYMANVTFVPQENVNLERLKWSKKMLAPVYYLAE